MDSCGYPFYIFPPPSVLQTKCFPNCYTKRKSPLGQAAKTHLDSLVLNPRLWSHIHVAQESWVQNETVKVCLRCLSERRFTLSITIRKTFCLEHRWRWKDIKRVTTTIHLPDRFSWDLQFCTNAA